MASGSRVIQINNKERAVSTDINRLQAFRDKMLSELVRYMSGVVEGNVDEQGGYITEYIPGAISPRTLACVVNGLLPYPVNGTVDMLVSKGLIFMEDAGYTAGDDSPFRYIEDPGVTVGGTLTLTTSPASTRIDVIECQYTDTVIETDSRDIFNTGTGLFTPTLVDKATEGRLTYRIRTGTPGAGFPGLVYGWVPLAVASVPASATTWDDVTLWDVRPLMSRFWNTPFNGHRKNTDYRHYGISADYDGGSATICRGKFEGCLGPYRVEGLLENHPEGGNNLDAADTTFHEAGLSLTDALYYVYSAMPFNLPFWGRYIDSSISPRAPYGLPGVIIVSQTAPNPRGIPSAALALPTATGLGSTTTNAIMIAHGVCDSGYLLSAQSEGDWVFHHSPLSLVPTSTAAVGGGTSQYNFTDGVKYPTHAKAIRIRILRSYTYTAPGADGVYKVSVTASIIDSITTNPIIALPPQHLVLPKVNGVANGILSFDIEIPLQYNAGSTAKARRLELAILESGTGPSAVSEVAYFYAVKM